MSLCAGLDDIGRSEWIRLARAFRDNNFCQMWDYGVQRASQIKAQSSHAVVRDGERVVGLAECRVKRLPLVRLGIAYSSGGPLLLARNGSGSPDFPGVLAALRRAYVDDVGVVLRLAPRLWGAEGEEMAEACQATGFAALGGVRPYRTAIVDLSQDLSQLRRDLHQSWRRHLRKAERAGVSILVGRDYGRFREIMPLYEQLERTKGFSVPLGASFYEQLQARLPASDSLGVMIARSQGVTVGGLVLSVLGETCVFILGASSERGRECRAAYLLHWSALAYAKRAGMRWYDLGGIDPVAHPGVYQFKSGLGGEEVTCVGPFQASPGATRRALVAALENVYRVFGG